MSMYFSALICRSGEAERDDRAEMQDANYGVKSRQGSGVLARLVLDLGGSWSTASPGRSEIKICFVLQQEEINKFIR